MKRSSECSPWQIAVSHPPSILLLFVTLQREEICFSLCSDGGASNWKSTTECHGKQDLVPYFYMSLNTFSISGHICHKICTVQYFGVRKNEDQLNYPSELTLDQLNLLESNIHQWNNASCQELKKVDSKCWTTLVPAQMLNVQYEY